MHTEFIIEPNTHAKYPDGVHKVRFMSKFLLSTFIKCKYKLSNNLASQFCIGIPNIEGNNK